MDCQTDFIKSARNDGMLSYDKRIDFHAWQSHASIDDKMLNYHASPELARNDGSRIIAYNGSVDSKDTHPQTHSAREGALSEKPHAMDKTPSAHSKILSEKSGLCSRERENKTNASIDEASDKLPDLSPKAECATFESTLIRFDRAYFRLAFRAIARDTDERTLIFSLLPKDCGFGHSMFANSAKSYILDSGQIRTSDISHTKICFYVRDF